VQPSIRFADAGIRPGQPFEARLGERAASGGVCLRSGSISCASHTFPLDAQAPPRNAVATAQPNARHVDPPLIPRWLTRFHGLEAYAFVYAVTALRSSRTSQGRARHETPRLAILALPVTCSRAVGRDAAQLAAHLQATFWTRTPALRALGRRDPDAVRLPCRTCGGRTQSALTVKRARSSKTAPACSSAAVEEAGLHTHARRHSHPTGDEPSTSRCSAHRYGKSTAIRESSPCARPRRSRSNRDPTAVT